MLNKVILMGRITAAPELKKTEGDLSVVAFTLAVERNYGKDKDHQTDFIRCVAWRQTAEFISRYFGKGQLMAVEGSIQVRSYVDKYDNKRQAVEVLVSQAFFAGNAGSKGSADPANDFGPPPPDYSGHHKAPDVEYAEGTKQPAPAFYQGDANEFETVEGDEDDLPF